MAQSKQKVLFICTFGMERSPSASDFLLQRAGDRFESKYAGISPSADIKLTQTHIDWADWIFVMEPVHKDWINDNLSLNDKDVVVLNINNVYHRDDPNLSYQLESKLKNYLDI